MNSENFDKTLDADIRKAAKNGDADAVRRLLGQRDGSKPLGVNAQGDSALALATLDGHVDCVRELAPISDLNARNLAGWRPLDIAAITGRADCAALLLNTTDLDAMDPKQGQTALSLAISCHGMECAKLLFSARKSPPDSLQAARAFLAAAKAGLEFVELLIASTNPKIRDDQGESALMVAAQCGKMDVLERLLPLSEPLAADRQGSTALMRAAERSAEATRLLAASGDCAAIDKNGLTALMRAAGRGQTDCVKILLPLSDAWAESFSGQPAFCLAWASGHAETADCLAFFAQENDLKNALHEFGGKRMPQAQSIVEAQCLRKTVSAAAESQKPNAGRRPKTL